MREVCLSSRLFARLERLYAEMEATYERVAGPLHFTCKGCSDNCCDSYFLHHTYAEWSYLRVGFLLLPREKQQQIRERSQVYVLACERAKAREERPQVMCPLNKEGLCILYHHRLMVCRTHGVPASMTRPDGQTLRFPGCFRCQEKVEESGLSEEKLPRVERTGMLRELAMIEKDLFAGKRHLYPKVRLTIAEMLVQGPPLVATPHCER